MTPKKVLDNYEGSEQLLLSVGKAYIIEAALEFFGMGELDDTLTQNRFVPNISHKSKEVKQEYFDRVIGDFVDQYLLTDEDAEVIRDHAQSEQRAVRIADDHCYSMQPDRLTTVPAKTNDTTEEEDYVRNYGFRILEAVMLLLQLKDTTKEGDGKRASINEKVLMMFFKTQNNYSKYAVEMVTTIAQKEIIASPRMAEVIRNETFVNWTGGKSRNIDDDTAIEICNCITKNMVREMGANKTEKAVERATKAAVGVRDIISNYDKVSAITPDSGKHTTRKSTEDEQGMIRDLRGLRPFRKIAGRRHASFPTIDRSAISNIDMEIYHRWISSKHVKQLTSAL